MAIKEMEVRKSESGSAEDKNSSKLNDIEESMQQRNAEINELNKKINELELLAETKLKEKQEMIEVANQQLTAEQKEKDGLYAKVFPFAYHLLKIIIQINIRSRAKLHKHNEHDKLYINDICPRPWPLTFFVGVN